LNRSGLSEGNVNVIKVVLGDRTSVLHLSPLRVVDVVDSLSPDNISSAKSAQISSNEVGQSIHLRHVSVINGPTSTSSPEISRTKRTVGVARVSSSTGGESLAQKVENLSTTTSEGVAASCVGSRETVQVTDSTTTTTTSRRGRRGTAVLKELSSSPSPVTVGAVYEINLDKYLELQLMVRRFNSKF
jgi:hypothetical protein